MGLSWPPSLSPVSLWGGAFVLYAGASLLWSSDPVYGAGLLASLVCSFVVGSLVADLRWFWIIVGCAALANLILIPLMPYGLYGNPNYLGCALALAIAGALAYEFWPLIPFLVIGLGYTGSRGAIIAAGVAFGIALWNYSRMIAIPVFLIAVVVAFGLSTGRDNSMLSRLGIWQDTMLNASVFGTGLGSFADAYFAFPVHVSPTEHMTGIRASHVYNDFLELAFELGLGAIPLWVLVLLAMEGTDPRPRLICFTFFILALTFFPLHVPIVGQAFALTLGHLTRTRERKSYGSLATA